MKAQSIDQSDLGAPALFRFELKHGIPDPGHLGLAARCGGDVRRNAFEAAAQLLRVISSFPPEMVRIGLYLRFDPTQRREKRTRIFLVGRCREGSDSATSDALQLLLQAGPLQSAYEDSLGPANELHPSDDWLDVRQFGFCQSIVRRESRQSVRPDLVTANHRLDGINQYFAVQPFKPRENNDWLGVDRLFDRLRHPAMIEVLAGPSNADSIRKVQFEYCHRLAQINAYESSLDRRLSEDVRRTVLDRLQQDPQADHFSQLNDDLLDNLRQPQLLFAMRCWSKCPVEGRLISSITAEECFEDGTYQLESLDDEPESLERVKAAAQELAVVPRRSAEPIISSASITGEHARFAQDAHLLNRLATICTPEELESAFRLPVARLASVPRTFSLHTDPTPVPAATWSDSGEPDPVRSSLLIGEDLEVAPATLTPGCLADAPTLENWFQEPHPHRAEIRLQRKHLLKHLFVCGVPGSGKTTAMFNFVAQLHYQNTPFLIIEPAKTEYRMFKKFRNHPDLKIQSLARDLRIFTLGDERVSPLRFNPLMRSEGVSIEEHMSALMDCFKGAMPLGEGPLESILQEALEQVLTHPPSGRQPRLSDLVDSARDILLAKGYDEEITSNLRAAIDVRLGLLTRGSLGRMLECDEDIPAREDLFSHPVVLEMDSLSQQHACLMTLLVLTTLRQRLRATSRSGSPLQHVVMLEEAHNIVGKASDGGHGTDPSRHAAEYVVRMLAEVRALGQGMIIADQLPSAVAPEVIKNTGSKLALRLVANDDREQLGGTMLLDDAGIEELARCSVGTGFFYTEGYYRPRRVQTFNSHALLQLTSEWREVDGKQTPGIIEFEPPDRRELMQLIQSDTWYQNAAGRRELLSVMAGWRIEATRLQTVSMSLNSARSSFLQARSQWFEGDSLAQLKAAIENYRGLLDSAYPEMEALTRQILDDLLREGRRPLSGSDAEKLVLAARRSLALGIWPLLSACEEAWMLCDLASALIAEEAAGEPAFLPKWLSVVDSNDLTPLFKRVLRESLKDMMTSVNEDYGELEGMEAPPQMPEWPPLPSGEYSPEDLAAYFRALERNLAFCLQNGDALALRAKKISLGLVYASASINPILAIDDACTPEFEKAEKGLVAMRASTWTDNQRYREQASAVSNEIIGLLRASGELDD